MLCSARLRRVRQPGLRHLHQCLLQLILQSPARGDDPTTKVVQFGWGFAQESSNLDPSLGNFVVYTLNVCRADAAAGIELESSLQRLPPGDGLHDQEIPEAGYRIKGCTRHVRGIVYSVGREHHFSTVFNMRNIPRGDVEFFQVVTELRFIQRALELANSLSSPFREFSILLGESSQFVQCGVELFGRSLALPRELEVSEAGFGGFRGLSELRRSVISEEFSQ
jgi:hypothetical protein